MLDFSYPGTITQSAAARGSCTLLSSMQHRPLRRVRRLCGSVVPSLTGALPSWKQSLDLALFLIGNRPEAPAQRDRGVSILETFFRKMVRFQPVSQRGKTSTPPSTVICWAVGAVFYSRHSRGDSIAPSCKPYRSVSASQGGRCGCSGLGCALVLAVPLPLELAP